MSDDLEETTIAETIEEAASENVRTVSVDGMAVTSHSIHELIAADTHTRRTASSDNPFTALRTAKLRPPSTA